MQYNTHVNSELINAIRTRLGGAESNGWTCSYKPSLNLNVKLLDFIQSGGPDRVRTCDLPIMSRMLFH